MRGCRVMRWSWSIVGVCAAMSCTALEAPRDLVTMDPEQDQGRIAAYYVLDAARLRQKAQELTDRAAAYELLFGRESDWARGTRLLAKFYEDTAMEQEREANRHMNLSLGGPSGPTRPRSK